MPSQSVDVTDQSTEDMLLPSTTRQLAQRIEQGDSEFCLSRLEGMQQARGNLLRIEIKRFSELYAFRIKAWPNSYRKTGL